jgi:hypothetical protein
MAQNEIAKLVVAYNKLWEDLEALWGDIHRIIRDEYSWTCFEEEKSGDDIVLFSYFSGNKILFFIVDAKEGSLKLALCSTTCKKITVDLLSNDEWRFKDGYNPFDYYNEEEYDNMPKKLSASSCFDVLTEESSGDWLFTKVDLMSIDSTDKVNTDVKKLLGIMIHEEHENYDPKSSGLKFI